MAAPAGPRTPALAQTMRWLLRHVDYLESLRERYGRAFTLRFTGVGPVSFINEPEVARSLFGSDRDHTPPEGRSLLLEPVVGPRSVLLLEGPEHLRRRRLMLPPFHGERMRKYEGIIAEVTAAEVDSWPRGPFELRERMQAITLEVILRAVFGVHRGARAAELRDLLGRVLEMTRRSGSQAIAFATKPLGRLGPWRGYLRLLDRVDALLAAEIAERRADPELDSREDILSLLVAARFENGEPLGDAELRDQLMTLLVAGHETTATALAWSWDLLLHTEGALKRARDSADDDAALDAIAAEALRLRPVITSVGRKLGASGTYGGFELEAGTSILVSAYLLHTDPEVYADPYEFRPQRFANGGPETYSWLPFGGGIRRCLGAAFAQREMRLVLAGTLRRVELEPAGAEPARPQMRGITLVPEGGVWVSAPAARRSRPSSRG